MNASSKHSGYTTARQWKFCIWENLLDVRSHNTETSIDWYILYVKKKGRKTSYTPEKGRLKQQKKVQIVSQQLTVQD